MKTRKTESAVLSKKAGVALFTVLTLLATLSLLASFSYMVMRTDMSISNNYVKATKAFYQTEAGIHYVRNQIEQLLKSGAPLTVGENAVNIEPPEGFTFDPVHSFTVLDSRMQSFAYSVTGHSDDSKTTIEVVVARKPLMMCGIMGDLNITMQPGMAVYSYDSRSFVGYPVAGDSTGQASIGSNNELALHANYIDGNILLGTDESGNIATVSGADPSTPIEEWDRFEPDPLGAVGGELEQDFARVIASNDNGSAPAIITGTELFMKKNTASQYATLTAGDYYFTDFYMGPDCELTIDNTDGPVNIYMDGELNLQPKCSVLGEAATGLRIFSRSTEPITFKPMGTSTAFIYAPYTSQLFFLPNGDYYGTVWTSQGRFQPGGNFFVDIACLNMFQSSELHFNAWKEVRTVVDSGS